MPGTTMIAALAVMMAATLAMANAQTATEPAGRAAVSANHLLPGQIRASEMNGATLYDRDNQDLGSIKDIILDRDGRVVAVILGFGATLGAGGKYVAIALSDIKVISDSNKPRFTVVQTKDQLKSAPPYDLSEKAGPTGTSTPPAQHTR
jgi:sporulation protein YlmC with PRC-barrel domain